MSREPDYRRQGQVAEEHQRGTRPGTRSDDSEAFDAGVTIAEFQRGPNERLRLARKSFRGHLYFDLRLEWRPDGSDSFLGTKKGVSIKTRELGPLAQALAELAAEGSDAG